MINEINKRNVNIDLIRCVAVWSVLSVHFFLNNGYYSEVIVGRRMLCMTIMRNFFMICVPLFLLLTGYLMNKKELSKKYYRGIIRTMGIYFLTSVVCVVYKSVVLAETSTVKEAFLKIFAFEGAGYSWYINMYIGLFLMIPFLNAGWKELGNKKSRKALIVTLLICTTLPSVMNIWNWNIKGWGIRTMGEYTPLAPSWWVFLYPVTYYFLGAYLKEYGFEMKMKSAVIALFASVMAFGVFNYLRNYQRTFCWDIFTDYASLQNVINSVLVFGIVLQIPTRKLSVGIRKIIVWISKNALGIYLVSEICDRTFYPILIEKVPFVPDRLEYYFVIVPVCFVCSAIMAQIILWIYEGIEWIAKQARNAHFDTLDIVRKG